MINAELVTDLNNCGCCVGTTVETPVRIVNRPGLGAIACRVGTHGHFKRSMLVRLASAELPALHDLQSRADDDFSVALLDAWATVADVLTFYSERIANESYLRTATEHRSLIELARLIGYRPSPGVAASTYLAFTLDQSRDAPAEVTIVAGTQAQSIPRKAEMPQIFETAEPLGRAAAWQAMRPRLTSPQPIRLDMREIVCTGVNTGLRAGDPLLIVLGANQRIRRIERVEIDSGA